MKRLALLVLAAAAALSTTATAAEISATLKDRRDRAAPDERIPILVRLAKQAIDDLEPPGAGLPRAERRRLVLEHLQRGNQASQDTLMPRLELGVSAGKAGNIQRYWLANLVAMEATPEMIDALAADPEVQALGEDTIIAIEILEDDDVEPEVPPAVNGIRRIRAPEVWNIGFAYTGFGAVVGSIDSGVDGTHDDLKPNFRGGANSWRDEAGTATVPVDFIGHGTHTTGTAVGGNRVGANYIGAAPGAQWIACRIFGFSPSTNASTAIRCMQWMADPDANPATDDLPDVVNGSWGADVSTCDQFLRPAVQGLRALEIVPVFAAGNHSVNLIPAAYPESIAVGAVNRANNITEFSGRGPSVCDGTIYPEFVAPGTKVKSAWPGNQRIVLRGTSMSTPHVSGTVALLRSRRPELTVAQIESILKQTALDLGPAGPDNEYGFGMVDAYRAMICVDSGAYLCPGVCP